MNQGETKEQILELLDTNKFGTLATVENNKPHTRYMTFLHEDFTLFTPTSKETHKAEEIENNPNVHILLGYHGGEIGKDVFLEVQGKAEIVDDEETKKTMWHESFGHWFKGPEDPEYVILKITPVAMRLMNTGEGAQSIEF